MVFGNTLINAQQYLVAAIPAGARVLIVGGGTGKILELIAAQHPAGLSITYIDSSGQMIALSRKRNAGTNEVAFIAADIQHVTLDKQYDVVFTAFFFDNFGQAGAAGIFGQLHTHLKPGGLWLYADFCNSPAAMHKAALRIMYLFFRVCCGIAASTLPDMATCFNRAGYERTGIQTFRNNWITAEIYHKQ